MNRYCNIFYCDRQQDFVCCATCQSRGRCRNRCLNDPSRCRLEDVNRRGEKPKKVNYWNIGEGGKEPCL